MQNTHTVSQCTRFFGFFFLVSFALVGLLDKFIKLSTKWASTALMSFSLLDNGWKKNSKGQIDIDILKQKKNTTQSAW